MIAYLQKHRKYASQEHNEEELVAIHAPRLQIDAPVSSSPNISFGDRLAGMYYTYGSKYATAHTMPTPVCFVTCFMAKDDVSLRRCDHVFFVLVLIGERNNRGGEV